MDGVTQGVFVGAEEYPERLMTLVNPANMQLTTHDLVLCSVSSKSGTE